MTEPKIEFVGEFGPEPITVEEIARLTIARALHDAVCPSGPRCDDSPTTWDRRWFQTAEVAVAALAKADLLSGRIVALSAPSEPVPDGPRVWAMPELPEDVSAVRDAHGDLWRREVDGRWREVGASLVGGYDDTLLLTSFGPLTEVVEP